MKMRSVFVLAALTSAMAGLAFAVGKNKDQPFTESGTLMEMSAVPCGSQERGFTGIGGLLATAGVEHVNAKDKLCQEYVLRTNFMQYRIRPIDEKHPVLLPVGEKAHFHLKGDHLLLTVPDGDDVQREYRVVGMRPLNLDDAETGSRAVGAPAAQVKPVHFSSTPAGTPSVPPVPQLERRAPSAPGPADKGLVALRTSSAEIPLPPAAAPSVEAAPSGTSANSGLDPNGSSKSTRALDSVQVMGLVAGGVSSLRVADLVRKRGISFQPDEKYLAELRNAGATDELVNALRAGQHPSGPEPVVNSDALQAQEGIARGAQLARAEHFAEAEQEYRKAERLRPQDPSVHFALGYALSQQGKWSDAASEYREVLASDPNDAAAHANLGVAMAKAGDVSGAIAEYRRALAIDPGLSALHNNLGVALRGKGDLAGARAEFRQALTENPNDPQIHTNLGSVLQQGGDVNGAIREYQQALSLPGGCCQAQYNLATALEATGDLDGAALGYQKVLKQKPDDARAHAGLASVLERKGDSAKALLEYETAVSLAPRDPEIQAGHDALIKRIQSGVDTTDSSGH